MKGLLTYSGIAAKVKAMEGRLITDRQFKTMAALESVPDAVGFLKTLPSYHDTFSGFDDQDLHRGTIERRLTDSLYHDFTKLYRFASVKQRRFLDLYFIHFETDILKGCLRNAAARETISLGLSRYEEFFKNHSPLDLIRISAAENLEEFIDNLEGTCYYQPLHRLRESGSTNLFDYEMALDLFYFQRIWRLIKKTLPASEQKTIHQSFGTKLDLLNLQWIYRTKKYYAASAETISALLIPIRCRLKKDQLDSLLRTETMEDFFSELSKTWYGARLKESDLDESPDLEILYRYVLNHMHTAARKKKPYSMGILYAYLYFKEAELKKIITIIESIRYNIDVSEINTYIEQH